MRKMITEILNLLDNNIYGISLKRFVLFFLIILLTFTTRSVLLYIIDKKIARLKITKSEIIKIIANAIKDPLGYLILIQGFYVAIISLQLPKNIGPFEIDSVIRTIYVLSISFIILYFAFKIIDIVGLYIDKKVKDKESSIDEQIASLIIKSLRILVATIGILSILSNFGYNVTSLIAGLGLGGLAFALAAQTTISNLFGSATIFSDKPFRIGDTVQIEDVIGTVEEVGFRTTRIRRSDQALVIVPNSKFVNNEIINYSTMSKRKIEFYLKIAYDTPIYIIKDLVIGIKKIIEEDETFDNSSRIVRFSDFADYSLNIYIYCLVNITDLAKFQERKEEFNLKIMGLMNELRIRMAYPPQIIQKDK